MNIFTTFSRIAVVAISVVGLINMAGEREARTAGNERFAQSRPYFIALNSVFLPEILKDKEVAKRFSGTIEPNNAVIIAKSLSGAMTYAASERSINELKWDKAEGVVRLNGEGSSEDRTQGRNAAHARAVGYVVINGSLRFVANKYSVNEDYIDKKCDEYFSEEVAWVAKPVANILVDLAYDYVTAEILKGIQQGINKSRNS